MSAASGSRQRHLSLKEAVLLLGVNGDEVAPERLARVLGVHPAIVGAGRPGEEPGEQVALVVEELPVVVVGRAASRCST